MPATIHDVGYVRFDADSCEQMIGNKMMNLLRTSLMLAALLFLSACGSSESITQAEAQIYPFREMVAAKKFSQIYAESSPELKKAINEKDFVALLAAVERKLGNVKQSTKTRWHVSFHTSGTFVTLVYDTQFFGGAANESFVFHVVESKPLLAGYNISSLALITN